MYELLATKIIEKACEDYMVAKKALAKKTISAKRKEYYTQVVNECVEFFQSDWFAILSQDRINPDSMIEELDKRVEKGVCAL